VSWLKKARRAIRAQLLGAAFWMCGFLPLRLALGMGAWLGRAAFAVAGSERRKALTHLAIGFPEKTDDERAAIARASFEQLGASALELTQVRKLDLPTYVRWPEEQIAAAQAALAPGNGGVLVFGHIGNWELIGPRLVASGFRGVAVGRDSGDVFLARRIEAFRKSLGVPIVGRGEGNGSLKEILRALRGGNLVAVLIDQDTRVDSVFVPFFGKLAHTPKAAEDLVRISKGCCLIAFIHREASRAVAGGHVLTTEVVDPEAPDLTARLTKRIEDEIRAHPADWVRAPSTPARPRPSRRPPTPAPRPSRCATSNSCSRGATRSSRAAASSR